MFCLLSTETVFYDILKRSFLDVTNNIYDGGEVFF